MARLAVAVEEDGRFNADGLVLVADNRLSEALFKSRDDRVMLYQHVPKTLLMFFGLGSVAGFSNSKPGELWRFDQIRRFPQPVMSVVELDAPGVRRMLALSTERYTEICRRGESDVSVSGEAGEAAVTYQPQSVDPYTKVHDEVLRLWSYRCAITGRQFAPGPRPHPDLHLVAIRPRQLGGPMHFRNYLPMIEPARRAWLAGGIGVGGKHDLATVPNRLPLELLGAMRPGGKLFVPENPAEWPDAEYLSFHMQHLFGA